MRFFCHLSISKLVTNWERENIWHLIRNVCYISIIYSSIALLFDFLLWNDIEGLKHYNWYRVLNIGVYLLILAVAFSLKKNPPDRYLFINRLIGIIAVSFVVLQHVYFLLTDETILVNPETADLLYTSIIALLVIYHFLPINYYKLSFGLFILVEVSVLVSSLYAENIKNVLFNIAIANLVLVFIVWLVRRNWAKFLYEKLLANRRLFPSDLAMALTINPSSKVLDEYQLRERPIGCLVIDWRGFQAFANKNRHSADKVNQDLSYFHEQLQSLVDKIAYGQNVYSHSADEAFVIIFDKQDNENNLQNTCIKIVMSVLNDFPNMLYKNVEFKHLWDIGFSYGKTLIGLVGPETAQKITIAGVVGGEAKRLEECAKNFRKTEGLTNSINPTLCIAQSSSFLQDKINFQEIESDVKDIEHFEIKAYNKSLVV